MEYFNTILVFPTNTEGSYRKGPVNIAIQNYGYKMGWANALVGESWPISTREADKAGTPLHLRHVKREVDAMLKSAKVMASWRFKVTSFPSHSLEDIAPMFALATKNVVLPRKYAPYIMDTEGREWWYA